MTQEHSQITLTPPPGDIPSDTPDAALSDARRVLREFVVRLEHAHDARTFRWEDLGVSTVTVTHLRHGRGVRPSTVQTVGRAAGFSSEVVARTVHATALLHRVEVSRGWQARKEYYPFPRRFSVVFRKRHYTPGGRWLRDVIARLWGSLEAFRRDGGLDPETVKRYFFNRTFHPKRVTAQRLADALNRRIQAGEAAVTVDDLLPRFGCGVSEEERHRRELERARLHPSRACSVCGAPKPRKRPTCGRRCSSLWRVLRVGLPTHGAKMLWALMAHAADVPLVRIGQCLRVPISTVEGWVTDPVRQETCARIRTAGISHPVRATAGVLGLHRTALQEYLHHRGYRKGRGRAPRPFLSKEKALEPLAGALHSTRGECLAAFERTGLQEDAVRQHVRTVQRRRWHTPTGGRRASACSLIRQIIRFRAQGRGPAAIADALAEANPHGEAPTENQVGWWPIRHARKCLRCRPWVAFDFRRRGTSIPAIARTLGVSVGTVAHDLTRAPRTMPRFFGYGLLTVHEVAKRARLSPDAIRWHVAHGHLSCTRTPSGWRVFDPEDVDDFLRARAPAATRARRDDTPSPTETH